MIDQAIEKKNYDIFELTPFFEIMGTWEQNRREFWWEREWRYRDNYILPTNFITLCPEEFHPEIKSAIQDKGRVPHCIDAKWSLEKIIAHLACFEPDEIGPF